MSEPTPPAPSPSGSSDVGPEPIITGVPDCAPTEAGPAAMEDTSISPTCESATVEAWSDEIEPIDGDPQTWRRTWVVAALLALAGIAVGAAVWFGHLAWPRAGQSDSQSASAPAPSPTPITNAAPPPAPAPTSAPAPPVTVTVQTPPSTVQAPPPTAGIPMEVVAAYDRQFLNNMVSIGWIITNPEAMVKNAHKTCALFQQGVTLEEVNRQLATATGMGMANAVQFSSTAMLTYPDCP